MKVAVLFPAAGAGRRFFEGGRFAGVASKIEAPLADKPVFLRSIEAFQHHAQVVSLILAVAPDRLDAFKLQQGDKLKFMGVTLVAGGEKERWETVLKAIKAVPDEATHIAVHDAARPLVSARLIDRVFEAAEHYDAVIPGHPVNATLKRVEPLDDADQPADPLDAILSEPSSDRTAVQRVVDTVDRSHLVEVQTPQIFERALLAEAYEKLATGAWQGEPITDDAGLIERMGMPVHVVDGEPTNLKITRPADLDLAEIIAQHQGRTQAASLGAKRLFNLDEED